MAQINMASVTSKVNAWANSSSGKTAINAVAIKMAMSGGGKVSPGEVAAAFISVMQGFIPAELSGISMVNSGITQGDETFTLTFDFVGNMARPSLRPDMYGGINNIVALLNNGYAASGPVFGQWHGTDIKSKVVRPGTHFVQNAVSAFIGQYGGKYSILSATVSGEYT